MGRRRTTNPLDLPERVYFKHGRFWYVRSGTWDDIGTDVIQARLEGERRNSGQGWGTVKWWYAQWLQALRDRIGKPKALRGISQRTFDDYTAYTPFLLAYFGDLHVHSVRPHHIAEYLQMCLQSTPPRPQAGNHERAALSAMFTWLMTRPESGVHINPCRGVKRNPVGRRERYLSDEEFLTDAAGFLKMEQRYLRLIYFTLQRPSDVLKFTPANVQMVNGRRVFVVEQNKTGAQLKIAVEGEFALFIDDLLGGPVALHPNMPLVHTKTGKPYTESGLAGMMRRRLRKQGAKSWGPMDMRAKGATDMYQSGIPIEHIQFLMAHAKITTTQIYIKRRLSAVVLPNQRKLA